MFGSLQTLDMMAAVSQLSAEEVPQVGVVVD